MKQTFAALLSIAFLTLFGSIPRSTSPATGNQAVIAPGEIGSRLPEFFVKDLRGHTISSGGLHGNVVLIDFWATWCQPCKTEMPGYQKLFERYRSRGFIVLGFKFDTMADVENPIVFASKLGIRYPLAIASDQLKQKLGGIEGLPTTMLYDREGILRKKIIGFEYTDVVEADLKQLF